MRILYISSIILLLASCKGTPQYNGDSMMNYPDMELIMKDYLTAYEQAPYSFMKIQVENDKKDSSVLKAQDIDWTEINKLFKESNLYDKKLDKQYVITVINDTLDPLMTLIYTSISNSNLVKKLNIKATNSENKIHSIYWETSKHGFMSKDEKKILYVVGKTLQIQEFEKKPFSSPKKKVTQYNLLTSS